MSRQTTPSLIGIATTCLVLGTWFATAECALAEDAIPVAPVHTHSASRASAPEPITAPVTPSDQAPSILKLKPGVNQIVPIAINHPNRFVTPSAHPEVVSASLQGANTQECREICIKDNVIYVVTDKTVPITLFITEQGSQAQALSLTMVPRRIPPREFFLEFSGLPGALRPHAQAKKWEQSQPYIETLRSLLRATALGELPPGYTLHSVLADSAIPNCVQPGMSVDFTQGQYLLGHAFKVWVGVVRNVTGHALNVHLACQDPEVAAVAAWPLQRLLPKQSTEFYIVQRQRRPVEATTARRPSLLGKMP